MLNKTESSQLNDLIGRNGTSVAGPYFQHIWIAAQVGCVVMFLGSILSIASFYTYGQRKGKWNNTKANRDQFILMLLTILTPCGVIIRVLLTQSVIITDKLVSPGKQGNMICEVLPDIVNGFFCLVTLPTYMFFWKRLRMLYSQPSLKQLDTKLVRVLTHFAMLLYVAGTVGGAGLIIIQKDHLIMSVNGCIKDDRKVFNKKPFYLCGVLLILSQLIMFILFVRPLQFHTKHSSMVKASASAKKLARRLKRANLLATMSMAVCTVSDFFAMIMVSAILPSTTPTSFFFSVYDFSCFVNIYAVMLSYEEYREIISFGRCTKKWSSEPTDSTVTGVDSSL